MQNNVIEKTCSRCTQTKSVSEYYAANRNWCAVCEKSQKAKYHGTLRGKSAQALQDTRKAVRKVGVEVKNDLTLFDVIWTLADQECSYCGRETPEQDRTLDHITPLKYNGGNTLSNVTMACKSCNTVKSDTPVILHFIREAIDTDEATALIERIANRGGMTFKEAFEKLAEDVQEYYLTKTQEAIEKAGDSQT